MKTVLDASVVLALLQNEPGADQVERVLETALISVVNWSEVLQKSLQKKARIEGMQQSFIDMGVEFKPFSIIHAELAADLWPFTKSHGLSLADRACLALAVEQNSTVLTTDKAWGKLNLDLDIRLLR